MTIELLQQVRLLDPVSQTDRVVDVLLESGVIKAIEATLEAYPDGTIVHPCQDMVLGPGLVDLYSHSGEPGYEERETLSSLLAAAAAGGFTRIAILPDTVPAMDNPASVAWLRERSSEIRKGAEGQRENTIHASRSTLHPSLPMPALHTWAALTANVQGQQMTELAELADSDIVGFADGKPLNNWLLVRRVLEYLRPIDKPVAFWACDLSLTGNGVMREGQESIQFGLPGIPTIAETTAIAALLECVETIGTPIHLMRVSTARSVELIQAAKARGVPVTASTTWMHLLFNSEHIGSYDPNLRLGPPLGNRDDQNALIQGLQSGVLDAIAVDHTPHTYEDKTVAFAEAPPGAIGLELALPLLWQSLVSSGNWSALNLWHCLSSQPAKCLHQSQVSLAPGQPAELTLFDPTHCWQVEDRSLNSLAQNTPWLGQEITGKVLRIWCP